MRNGRTLVVLVVAAIGLVACSSSGSSTAPATTTTTTTTAAKEQPRQTVPTQTRFVVDGKAVNLVCKGNGRIPVVFQAGGRAPGVIWNQVVDALGPDVFTCVFDRPGTTDAATIAAPPTEVTTPRVIANMMVETLRRAGVGPRVVLVGHSAGGMDALVFGAEHPEQVAGAVLFDPSQPTGVADREEWESIGFDVDPTVQQERAVKSWPDVPLVVLTADSQMAIAANEATPAEEADWIKGHQRMAALSSKGVQREVPGTTHNVYLDAPDLATATIRQVLADAGGP